MDREKLQQVLDSLFRERTVVTRTEFYAALDSSDMSEDEREAAKALLRKTYTRPELERELAGIGRDVPIGSGSVFGGG